MRKTREGMIAVAGSKGLYAHIYCRCSGRDPLLKEPCIKNLFSAILEGAAVFSDIKLLSHAFMDTHMHLLVWIPYFGVENERRQREMRPDTPELLRRHLALNGADENKTVNGNFYRTDLFNIGQVCFFHL